MPAAMPASEHAAVTTGFAALDAADGREFEVSAWAFGPPDESRAAAEALGCHRLIQVDLGPLV